MLRVMSLWMGFHFCNYKSVTVQAGPICLTSTSLEDSSSIWETLRIVDFLLCCSFGFSVHSLVMAVAGGICPALLPKSGLTSKGTVH